MARTEKEIEREFGKSIWDMTPKEMVENDLVHDWVAIVDGNAGWTDEMEDSYWEAHKMIDDEE